jgi:hypothetical protein
MEASNRRPKRYSGGLSGHSKRSALFQDRTFLFAIGGAFTAFFVRLRKRQFHALSMR